MARNLSDTERDQLLHDLFGDPLPVAGVPRTNPALEPTKYEELPADKTFVLTEPELEEFWNQSNRLGSFEAKTLRVSPVGVLHWGKRVGVLEDGLLGYCFVDLQSKHPFAKWLVRRKYAKSHRRGVVSIYISHDSCSALRAAAHGRTLAHLFRDAGIPVIRVEHRLD